MDTTNSLTGNSQFHFILADDDADDRFFFERAISEVLPRTQVSYAEDGEKLMNFLRLNVTKLPEVLFLDLNMPRKNGAECLREIRNNSEYNNMAIIIYSTSSHDDVADVLFKDGAHYYVRKPDLAGLIKVLRHVVQLLLEKRFDKPEREKFILELK